MTWRVSVGAGDTLVRTWTWWREGAGALEVGGGGDGGWGRAGGENKGAGFFFPSGPQTYVITLGVVLFFNVSKN